MGITAKTAGFGLGFTAAVGVDWPRMAASRLAATELDAGATTTLACMGTGVGAFFAAAFFRRTSLAANRS